MRFCFSACFSFFYHVSLVFSSGSNVFTNFVSFFLSVPVLRFLISISHVSFFSNASRSPRPSYPQF